MTGRLIGHRVDVYPMMDSLAEDVATTTLPGSVPSVLPVIDERDHKSHAEH
jgi:hypothetical protein